LSSWTSHLRCAGCGRVLPEDEPLPFACPARIPGDDVEHVLEVVLDLDGQAWPAQGSANPFLRYRELMHSYRLARRRGMSDTDYVALVNALDGEVAAVDGHGFSETPYRFGAPLAACFKDETGQPSGSHKARHLMGIAIHLAVVERLGLATDLDARPLAIASCGNAALAAAVIARAMDRRLQVFVPPWADRSVVARLDALGAERIVCPRQPNDPPGDPCVLRYREAVGAGALPFACQGVENGLTIDGGQTLAWELCQQHREQGRPPLEHLFVQVGGGALATATIRGLRTALALGALPHWPAIHAVQPRNAHPLRKAWKTLEAAVQSHTKADALAHARTHRSQYMQPWPDEPKSIATGIVDDETYDWLAVVEGLLESGGSMVLASEDELAAARALAAQVGVDASETGTAGLAGLLEMRKQGQLIHGEEVAVLFTGARR